MKEMLTSKCLRNRLVQGGQVLFVLRRGVSVSVPGVGGQLMESHAATIQMPPETVKPTLYFSSILSDMISLDYFFPLNLLFCLSGMGGDAFEAEKPVVFACEEIFSSTNGFSDANLLGHGTYGSVYYGILREQVGQRDLFLT